MEFYRIQYLQKWDEDANSNFGHVKLRNLCWISYFTNHIKSARHKRNCMRKAYYEEENRKQIDSGEAPKKRMKQTILPCNTLTRDGEDMQLINNLF